MDIAINIIIAVVCLLGFSIYGWYGAKADKDQFLSFLVAERGLSSLNIAFSMAAGVIGGGVLLLYSEYTYNYGLSAFSIFGGIALGLLCLYFVAKKYKSIADQQKLLSLPEMFYFLYGKRAGFMCFLVVFFWALGFICMQLVSAGILLGDFIGIPYEYCVILSGALVIVYLLKNGFKSVVKTDVVHALALLAFFGLVLIFLIPKIPSLPSAMTFKKLGIENIIGFFLLGLLNIIVSADLWQRIYGAKNESVAKKGILGSFIVVLILGCLLTAPILLTKNSGIKVEPNNALIQGVRLVLPRWGYGFAFAAIMSAILSTLDTMIFIAGLSFANDFMIRFKEKASNDRVGLIRLSMLVITILGILGSIYMRSLLEIGLALSSLGLCLVPAVVVGVFKKDGKIKSHLIVELSILFGLIGFIALVIMNCFSKTNLLTPETALITLPASILGYLVGLLYSSLKNRFKNA